MNTEITLLLRRAGRIWIQGALLFGLRLAHLRTGFDPATGLSVPSVPGKALAVIIAVCMAAELLLSLRLPRGKASFAKHFSPPDKTAPLAAAGSLLLAAGGALLLVSAVPSRNLAAMAAGVLGIVTGAGVFQLVRTMRGQGEASVLPLLPALFFGVFLVLTVYIPAENDPVLARFYIPVLAASLTAYAFGQLAGFLRREGSLRSFTVMADLAVMLCLAAVADGGGLGRMLLFAGCAVVLSIFLSLRREGVPPDVEDGKEKKDA